MKPHPQLRRLLPVLLLALLQGCASQPVVQAPVAVVELEHPHALFGEPPLIPTAQELFTLSAAQQQALDAFMAAAPGQPPHERLGDYLQQLTRRFNYQEATLTASEALQLQRGNCLTLAILTTALARHTGVGIRYQLVNDVPVYQFGGSAVLKGVHVRSLLFDADAEPQPYALLASMPGVIIDYFPSGRERFIGNLDTAAFIASWYRNRATDFVQQGQLNEAWWYAQQALGHAPADPESINLLAVIGRRAGDAAYAERMYLHGIASADNKLSLLKNYRILLLAQQRLDEARQVELRLARMDDPSPFHWFLLAQSALDDGDFAAAIRYYRRALQLAPYLHEANLGLAAASYQAGDLPQAREQLLQALAKAQRASTRLSYKAKLLTLERELSSS